MHDLTLAAQYAERMVLLDSGRVVADGVPRDVLTEETIARHYGASIDIVSVEGRIAVIPPPRLSSSKAVGLGMPRLVEQDVVRSRHLQHDAEAEAHVLDRARELGALLLELGLRGLDVVAHQRDRVVPGVGERLALVDVRSSGERRARSGRS